MKFELERGFELCFWSNEGEKNLIVNLSRKKVGKWVSFNFFCFSKSMVAPKRLVNFSICQYQMDGGTGWDLLFVI